ncbi:MAG TPA: hypothetical protein VKT80_18320, partial [Chloroflexota bacterium]|nr:hypothetical protein [Chloroflexota bacterium]
ASSDPSIRYKTRVHLLGDDPASAAILALRQDIRESERVRKLLAERTADGTLPYPAYAKWYGAHWVLAALADLDYPPGDDELDPLREQVYAMLFSETHVQNARRLTIAGRTRMCASIEGNAINALLAHGLADERVGVLAKSLLAWQWPDGGWNCDKHREARVSSFTESLIPLRGLARYARTTGDASATVACRRAAEVFLERRLFRRKTDDSVISPDFLKLHHPCYWHYDILFALRVMDGAGFLEDPRCAEALAILENKRLPDGGFPADEKYYQSTSARATYWWPADWGGTSRRRANQFMTVEALAVLRRADVRRPP